MDIFISYRRSDNSILAGTVAELLGRGIDGARVFFDEQGIEVGRDYRQVIDRQIDQCHVLIAMIGPSWEGGGRLNSDHDFIRYELERARSLNKHVIPVVHSNREMPLAGELAPELRWISALNAATLRTRHRDFLSDVGRLCDIIRGVDPQLNDLRNRVWSCYETWQDEEALRLADEAWALYRQQPSPGLADCCRAAALVLTRQGRVVERELWRARTITTGVLGGGRNAVAFSLLPSFFQLASVGFHTEARSVLDELGRLIEEDPAQLPPPNVLRRLYFEKLAWSLNETGDLEEAVAHYDQAILVSPGDLRGVTKARGGRAISRFRLGYAAEAIADTEEVRKISSNEGWADLERAAEVNLEAMHRGGDFAPYEIV